MESHSMFWICVLATLWIPHVQPYSKDGGRQRSNFRAEAPLDDEESDVYSGDGGTYVNLGPDFDVETDFPGIGKKYQAKLESLNPGVAYELGYRPKQTDIDESLLDLKDPLEELDQMKPAMLAAQNDTGGYSSEQDILEEIRRQLALDDDPIYDPYGGDYYDYDEETTTPPVVVFPTPEQTKKVSSDKPKTTASSTTTTTTTTKKPTTTPSAETTTPVKPVTSRKTTQPNFTPATEKSDGEMPVVIPGQTEHTTTTTTTTSVPPPLSTEPRPAAATKPAVDEDVATKISPVRPEVVTKLQTAEEITAAAPKQTEATKELTSITKSASPDADMPETPKTTSKTSVTATTRKQIPDTIPTLKTSPRTTKTTTTEKTLTPTVLSTIKTTTTTERNPTIKTSTTKRIRSSTTTTTTKTAKSTPTMTTRKRQPNKLPAVTEASIVTQKQEATSAEITGDPAVVPQKTGLSLVVLIICVISFVIVLIFVVIVIFIVRARLRRRGKYDISSDVDSDETNGSVQNGKAVKFEEDKDKKAVVTVQYHNANP